MIPIPKVSFDEIASYYSLIRVSHLGIASPVSCSENTVSRTWEAPVHPVEDGKFIGDTIYEEPKSINVAAYIRADRLHFFEAQIKLANELGIGFTLFTMGGVYTNMFVVSLSRPETASVSTGYLCDITFQEIPTTSFLGTIIALGSSAIASAINTVNTGTVQPLLTGALESLDSLFQVGVGL